MYKKVLIFTLLALFLSTCVYAASDIYYDSNCISPGDGTDNLCNGDATDPTDDFDVAYNSTDAGGTLHIQAGVHTPGNLFNKTITKGITIQGDGAPTIANTGSAANNNMFHIQNATTGTVTFKDMTIRCDVTITGKGAIVLNSTNANATTVIDNVTFTENGAQYWDYVIRVGSNEVGNVEVFDCTASGLTTKDVYGNSVSAMGRPKTVSVHDNSFTDIKITQVGQSVVEARDGGVGTELVEIYNNTLSSDMSVITATPTPNGGYVIGLDGQETYLYNNDITATNMAGILVNCENYVANATHNIYNNRLEITSQQAYMEFNTGTDAAGEPPVGTTMTGAVSGATGTITSITTSGGNWLAGPPGTATGTVNYSVRGKFQNGETVNLSTGGSWNNIAIEETLRGIGFYATPYGDTVTGVTYNIYYNTIVSAIADCDALLRTGDPTAVQTAANPTYNIHDNIMIGPAQVHGTLDHGYSTIGMDMLGSQTGTIKNNYFDACPLNVRMLCNNSLKCDASAYSVLNNIMHAADSTVTDGGYGLSIVGTQNPTIKNNFIIVPPASGSNYSGGILIDNAPNWVVITNGNSAAHPGGSFGGANGQPIPGQLIVGSASGATALVMFSDTGFTDWTTGNGVGQLYVHWQTVATFTNADTLTIDGTPNAATVATNQTETAPSGMTITQNAIVVSDNSFPFIVIPTGYTSATLTIENNYYGYWDMLANDANVKWQIGGGALEDLTAWQGAGFDSTITYGRLPVGGGGGRNIGFGYWKQ